LDVEYIAPAEPGDLDKPMQYRADDEPGPWWQAKKRIN
jgi:hypothetical protein